MSLLCFEKFQPKSEKFKKLMLYMPMYFSMHKNNAIVFAWMKCYIYKNILNT